MKKRCVCIEYSKLFSILYEIYSNFNVSQTVWVSSPKESVFPETIPEEASSIEEERVVIFRLPYSNDDPSLYRVI